MEVSLVNAMSRESILRQYLETVKEQYSHILIDCQPSLGYGSPVATSKHRRWLEVPTEPTGETIPDPYEKRRLPMANRKRNIQMKFYVTEEEKRLIDEKMAQLPTRRYGAYLRKMAIDGYIIQLDTTDIKRMNAALSAIGRNINQIAKRVNAGGSAYKADMREIQERLDEIWQLQRRILSSGR